MNKTKSLPRTLALCAALAFGTRVIALLTFSSLAYMTDDPGANLPAFSIACKIFCDALCGFMISTALGKDFSRSTRIFFALTFVIIINVLELLIGKLMFPESETAFYMIPISVMSSFPGAFLIRNKKIKKRSKYKRR